MTGNKIFLGKSSRSLLVGSRGFALFFAALISAVILSIAASMYDITRREFNITQVETQSQYAIYAADAGAECALYWDHKFPDADNSAFATSNDYIVNGGIALAGQTSCNGQDIVDGTPLSLKTPSAWDIVAQDATHATTTFAVSVSSVSIGEPCAIVTVAKFGTPSRTVITSRGYNSCSNNVINRIERTLQVIY